MALLEEEGEEGGEEEVELVGSGGLVVEEEGVWEGGQVWGSGA